MEQKPVAGRHLGGILRIFAKSVRDAAKNKKPTKSKPLESKVSSSDDQNDGIASDTSPRSEARSKTIIRGDGEHLSQILTIRTRRNSENIVNKQDLQEQKTISNVSKTLSLDNLADHSFEGKENHYPKFQKNKDSPKKMEDWGSDLLDVDSCRNDNGHDSAVVRSGLCGGSSVTPVVSSGRRKSSSDVCHRTVISHDIHVQLEEQECSSSSVNSTTQKVCKKSKEQESLRIRGEKLKKSEKPDRYHKHHRHGFQKENESEFHDKPVENTRKDVNKVHKKHNIKDGMPQNMVKDSCQPMTHKFSETKERDQIQGKENDSTDQIDSKLPRNVSHNCIDNGSSNDEDWSSELLVVVSRSSPKLTDPDADASILGSTTDIQEDNLVMSPEENSDSVSLDSEQDLRTVKIEVVKGENERFHSSQCSAVFAEEMSDSLDVTLTGVEDEDWSTDLMSVPSSASTSPESGRNLAIAEEYDNTHQHDQTCHCGNEVSDSEGCPLEEASCQSQSNQSDDLEAEGSFKDVLVEGDDYLNEKDIKIRKQVVDPVSRQYTGFVDDSSDMASDHECVSDLDSQGSGIGRTESVNDDTDNYNFLSQEDYQDHAPTCTCHIQSENDCSRRKKREAKSVSFGNVNQDLPRNLQHRFHEEQLPKDQTREEISPDTGYHIQDTPPGNCYPFLCIPLENIKSRASIEKLMEYIANVDLSHQMYPMEARNNHQDQGGNVWFNVTQNPDRQELHVGMNPHHPPNHAGGYPWTWPYGWTPYTDPRYEMYDPNISPSRLKAYYDSIWHNYQSGYPYSYMHSWEGVDSKMPADDCQSAHPVATRDQKIVDYESSSEDEIMAKLASKHMMGPIYRSTGHQNYVGAEPGRKSYAACVTGNKRSLPENLRVSGKKLHNLGAPKPARAMPGVCVDWNKSMLYDKQELEILNKEKVREKTQRQVIEQCKMSSIDGEQRNVTQGLMNNECRSTDGTNPQLWSQTRRNRFITDNPDLQETYELGTYDRKDSISGGMREAMKSAGCYPYDTIQKMTPKYEETENCCKKTHIPQLIPPGQWSSWAIGKSPESLKRETHTSGIPEYGQASRNETESNPIMSTPSPPPPVPVCPPYWGDPRMSFPVPTFYPPQWLPSFPNNYSPGFMPYPPPPSTTSPTNISPAMNTGSTTISSPTSTSSRFPYRSQQTTSFRSRTTSEPAPVVDQITERVEEPGVDKSCKSYFLAAKNRRVSDSVLRTDSEEFVPRRSSYASRLQNDARLNANFPQLDWRIRLKSRCKGYGVGFIDTHCHLDFLFNREGFKGTFAKYMLKHEETFPENFEGCVAVFCNPASFLPKSGLWRDVVMESNVWLAMGCHPKNVTSFDTVAVEGLKQCINHPKIIAVGEIGLDYSGTFRQHEVLQKKMFAYQLQLALDVKKPLVIHCRQAEEDCLAIMEEIVPKNYKIHCHCFTGTYEQCKKWLTKFPKLYIGLTNLVSFRSATPTHEVAKYIPLGRLLLETDAPYFVPRQIPKGAFELSHPGMAVLVAEEVARIKEIPVGQLLKACRNNTLAMYGI
ncbi:uncharacterized protein [Haliotis cracherodii]|uniref:uncharacterized protein n=1 Tax=Haliotis cracherodii TaxID=6455 RepID=UPI0039E74230